MDCSFHGYHSSDSRTGERDVTVTMAECGSQKAIVRGKRKFRYRKLDPLRNVLGHIKSGEGEAAKKALTPELRTLLQERLVASSVPKDSSPLVLATQYNRRELLHNFRENFDLNLEQETSTVIEGSHLVEGATPLWTAATLGYTDTVKDLVEWGANVEHTTYSGSSPLRGAALNGHLDVVEFLAGKGADIDKPNHFGHGPLAAAALMQRTATVSFLLKSGANVHRHGHNGDTPLHVAGASGSLEVTRILVEAGARTTPNDAGHTPAIIACSYGYHKIMNFLHTKFLLSPKEQHDCYCLLCANYALKEGIYIYGATFWIGRAIDIRQMHPEINEDLASFPADSVYDGVQEPSRVDVAIRMLTDDVHRAFLGSVYCERILGTTHSTTASYIAISGNKALGDRRYKKCMQLWLRSLEFDHAPRMPHDPEVLLFFVCSFVTMLEENFLPVISQHFEWGIKEFKLAQESKIPEVDVCRCLCRMLAVWFLAVDATPDPKAKQAEKENLVSAARQLCFLTKGCNYPLLLACLRNSPGNTSAATIVASCKLPLHSVVELLIELGCSVDCEDDQGNYPLHLAVMLCEDSSLKCVQSLVESGAHIDAVNYLKETPLDLAGTNCGYHSLKDDLIDYLSRATRENCSLQCLAAKALVAQGQNYIKLLPPHLVSFVAQHGSDEQDTEQEYRTDLTGSLPIIDLPHQD